MTVSIYTFSIFVFLLPGLVFRISLYQYSIVKRTLDTSNAVPAVLTLVFFALLIHFALYAQLAVSSELMQLVGWQAEAWKFSSLSEIEAGGARHDLQVFLLNNPGIPILYTTLSVFAAWALGRVVNWLASRIDVFARLLNGPLYQLLKTEGDFLITCFVLTTISHENRRMVYAGVPAEIGIKEGGKIDYLVLKEPEKFYLRLNRRKPETSLDSATPISRSEEPDGFLLVTDTEIENVHIEVWYLGADQ